MKPVVAFYNIVIALIKVKDIKKAKICCQATHTCLNGGTYKQYRLELRLDLHGYRGSRT
jgi:hypothetical protein